MPFKSTRISRTCVITVRAPLATVFPLFGPIREKEWADGWDPELVFPPTGAFEEHMVFRTPGHHEGEPDYTWTISVYRPDGALVEYTVFTQERLWWITIQCREGAAPGTTEAEITYTYTGLTERGNALNRKAMDAMFHHDLKDWEEAIHHFLQTGRRLEQAYYGSNGPYGKDLMQPQMTTTAFTIDGFRTRANLGVVRGVTVRSRSLFGTFGAKLQTLAGGNISLFTELCEKTRADAFNQMVMHAETLGANAVIGVRYDANDVMEGVTEVLCYGTAMILEPA
jgi:uncharacterized protein YbjQ (UPF0145 family)